ncbi:MAG TPA: methyltransferase domain-containing protein [Thermoanaerobaculia bacterium]|nr:methyltransferase domain-containing protein [Thermoanaerobaculia bacterium]
MRYLQALRFLHRTYRGYPFGHRLHVFIRFLTCPFLRTLGDLPQFGSVLEIGAGHGIYSYFAAHRGHRVFAVEPDLRKSIHPEHAPGVQWIAGYDECIRGVFDAAVIYDATYRMPVAYRTEVYRRAFERLAPGGTFLLKDMDPRRSWKMAFARLQEWLSDRFLKISIGSGFIYQTRAEVEATLRAIGFEDIRARAIDRGYPHPHLIYTARKPRIMDAIAP